MKKPSSTRKKTDKLVALTSTNIHINIDCFIPEGLFELCLINIEYSKKFNHLCKGKFKCPKRGAFHPLFYCRLWHGGIRPRDFYILEQIVKLLLAICKL